MNSSQINRTGAVRYADHLAMGTPQSAATHVTVTERHGYRGKYVAYQWQNVAIIAWFDGPTMESLRSFERGSQAMIDEHPEGMSSVNILVPGGVLPTAAERRELSRILDSQAPHVACSAYVMRGDGFFAGAMRGLLTALQLLQRKTFPQHVFSDYAPVVKWLLPLHAERTAQTLDSNELLAALRQVDAACMPKRPREGST